LIVLTLAIRADLSDAAAGLLHRYGASGVELRDADSLPPPGVAALESGRAEVRGYFESASTAEDAAEELRLVLGVEPDLEELPVEDWTASWKQHFRPVRRGRVLVVAPWMREPAPAGAVRVVIEPGLAFGTGDHPTTGMCLEALDVFLQREPGAAVLDVGTGSGILAIAARKLGAGLAVGTDNDPVALRVARENATVNGTVIDLRSEIPEAVEFDLVLANILSNTLVELAPRLVRAVAPGGRLVLSGILEAQTAEIEAAYRPLLKAGPSTVEGEWVCLEFEAETGRG
jgi:ribosomal protein L11 methyltransferase